MPDELDPNKFHVMSKQKQRNIFLISILILLLVLPPLTYGYYKFAVTRPSQTEKEIVFEIRNGSSVSQIAAELHKAGALNSEFLFTFYVFLNGLDKNIQAGVYTVKAGSSVVQLADLFQHGVNDQSITFLEGWRVEEFARAASTMFSKIDYRKFVELAKKDEGYLFPDTYQFNNDITEEELYTTLRTTFDEKTKDVLTDTNLRKAGLSKSQAVIIASIVEREANNEDDRRKIAGILINRWKSDIRLDADATTQYAVAQNKLCPPAMTVLCVPTFEEIQEFNWWPNELTVDDLEFDSPYNTRKNAGLPPAPISSVGLNTLKAVLNYESTDYVYYLTDLSGQTHYARTLEEHNQNVAKYLSNLN